MSDTDNTATVVPSFDRDDDHHGTEQDVPLPVCMRCGEKPRAWFDVGVWFVDCLGYGNDGNDRCPESTGVEADTRMDAVNVWKRVNNQSLTHRVDFGEVDVNVG